MKTHSEAYRLYREMPPNMRKLMPLIPLLQEALQHPMAEKFLDWWNEKVMEHLQVLLQGVRVNYGVQMQNYGAANAGTAGANATTGGAANASAAGSDNDGEDSDNEDYDNDGEDSDGSGGD